MRISDWSSDVCSSDLFEEFMLYEQPTNWGEQGLGLGLSICQRISHILDQPLHVRSTPGRGSMFSMFVPRARGPAAALPMQRTALPHSLSGLRALCVETDSDILPGMAQLLGRWALEEIGRPSCMGKGGPDV